MSTASAALCVDHLPFPCRVAALQAQDVALCAASDQSVDRVARVNLLGRQEELCWDAYMAVEYWVDLGALAAAMAARAWLWRAM